MTEAPPRQPASPPRELRRSSEGRFLMGVCAGLGRHTGIDPVVFRAGFTVLLLGSGIGLFLYLAAFLLMKEPNGRPGIIEQWTRRDFDAETVMALLTAVLGFGLAINLATVWLDTGTLVVGVFLAVSLLAAHSSGVDLRALARSMPERLSRRRGAQQPAASYESAAPVRAPQPPEPPAAPEPPHAPAPPSQAPAAQPAVAGQAAQAAQAEQAGLAERAEQELDATAADEPTTPVGDAEPERHAPAEQQAPGRQDAPAAQPVPEAVVRKPEQRDDEEPVSPYAITAEHRIPPHEPTPTYRPNPPTTIDYGSHGEPFAPNGPYRPLDPARRPGGYSPYDPSMYRRPAQQRRRRPRSFIGLITILLALIIGGIVVAVQARSAAGVSPTIVGGAMLITIGAGLLVAAWWGRGAGLVAAGTAVALIVGMGLMLGGMPRNIGTAEWAPTTIAEVGQVFDAGLGDGTLDLSELQLPPGSNVTVNATISAGELVVIVPPTARVEVHASNKIGDIVIDQSLRGGVDVRTDKILEPEVKPKGKAATIVLNLRGGLGDMEVRRAA
ncbi:PspC domain-containing protein [Nonomuraea rubra]|uniref:Phage shock protein PspC (Stress-responsive transcriptional regulator) n=1 Tax=Nonomuraea rubra TaxID=46180 RepID=A0A7X0P5J8_9ACTN|nr:PspC domain-containing protein [Nonomuraea rubra]MBB6555654.1 phage shock protein PspC (stress-responsive transcriptional regulator) [Nonomuraea rubra]